MLFLERLFHLHEISSRRAGKAAMVRLSSDQFALECDRMCLQAFILESMGADKESFPDNILEKVRLSMLEGKLALIVLAQFFQWFSTETFTL